MKDFFKPSDFREESLNSIFTLAQRAKTAATQANVKLQKYVESLPVVKGVIEHTEYRFDNCIDEGRMAPTHTARLWDIQEIKKECQHEPMNKEPFGWVWVCKKCSAKLVAEWKEI